MPVTQSQIKFYKSLYVNDTDYNGGRIGTEQIVDSSMDNLFRNIQSEERISGIDLYRKFFIKNENPSDIVLQNIRSSIANVNVSGDYFQFAIGTDDDYQGDAKNYTDWYGVGILVAEIIEGDSSFAIDFKQASGLPSDCLVSISDGIQASILPMIGDPIWDGLQASVLISGEVPFTFAAGSIVSAVIELDDLTPLVANWTEISSGGTYNESVYPLSVFNIGAISESWTLVFTSPTAFTVTGAVIGSVGSGTISGDFNPINGASYYFRLLSAGWGGSWVLGDTITWTTRHAARSLWVKESVPAGANVVDNNLCQINFKAESA